MNKERAHLRILGTRGIPAEHGGFETFAQECALYMQKKRWRVTVYCQVMGTGPITEDTWQSIRRVLIPVNQRGPVSTMIFDWRAIKHASKEKGIVLCLGYNTAIFNLRLRFKGISTIINMDGIEWKRDKWSRLARWWLYLNEKAGLVFSEHLIADNPGIADHLVERGAKGPLTTIPYGAPLLENISSAALEKYGLSSQDYLLLIARPEPENSILEIVRSFSAVPRSCKLVVLGSYSKNHPYQKKVLDSASTQVVFLGAIYDQSIVSALRFHCLFYVHGHTVGGTNPSLVEAMGAGNAILAHGNVFNRWVTGPDAARFFNNESECLSQLNDLIEDQKGISNMKKASRSKFLEMFTWEKVLKEYENCFANYSDENNNT